MESGSEHSPKRAISEPADDLKRWLYVLVLLVLVSLVAFLYLAQASYVAKQTEEMKALESNLRELKKDNNALLLRIAQYEQMPRIEQEARALGFGEPEHIGYVEVVLDEPAPLLGGEAAPDSLSPSPDVSSHLPTWLHNVLCQFREWVNLGTAGAGQVGSRDSE